MRIQHNVMAMNAYRNYTNNVSAMKKNLEKLSSGYKINRAGDDAAGLAISEKMRAQITGLETAQKNAKDGISLVQTAEGALTEVHDMLNRMVELATQSANGTYDNDTDRFQLQKEMDQLRTEINRIADSANFNGIKLFDGSLSGADITATGLEASQIDMAKGVDVVQGSNGGGSNGTFTINLDSAFGDGDTLTLNFGGLIADTTNGDSTASKALVFGTDFEGNTIEDQAKSIAKALAGDAAVGKRFDVTYGKNSVTLTARVEGNQLTRAAGETDDKNVTSTVTEAKVTANGMSLETTWDKNNGDVAGTYVAGTDGTAGNALIKDVLFNTTTGLDVSKGDVLEFSFKLNDAADATNGTVVKAQLTAGEDFEVGASPDETLKNIATALSKAKLMANEDTIFDDTKVSVGDLFTITTEKNTGGSAQNDADLKFVSKDGAAALGAAADISITNLRSNKKVDSAAGTAVATPVKASITLTLDDATGRNLQTGQAAAANLNIGDKLTFKGKLADGRTFEVEIEAGKDFKIDKDNYLGATSTMANIKELLESDAFEVKLSDGSKVKGSDIFGDKAEIKITATDGKFESNRAGTHTGTELTSVKLTPGESTSITANLKNGDQRTSANSTITLSEGVSYGAVVEVDGKKYELVKAAGDVSNASNKAVIVDDISDLTSAAKALATAIKADVNDENYKVTSSEGTVTIASTKVGSAAQAIGVDSSGDKTTQLEFTLDPKKMKSGSTVTINGQTYEFVDKGKNASDKTYTAIEVTDFGKETASSLGGALAKLANGQKNASVTMDENGKVTVRGLVDSETNKIVTPTVKFDGGTSGLKLQIGDTAEDFNQMTVSIYNMHTADMGIGDIRIDNQEDAAKAIDAIKSAINYVSDVRGTLGATQNRLDHTINNLSVMTENIQDAESTIRDTDVAAEMMAYTKNNILIQSAQAMLAQANQVPQGVLQLLQ